MPKGKLHVLVEPGYAASTWFAKSFSGLRSGAARKDISVEEIQEVQKLQALPSPGILVLMGADAEWIHYAIAAASDAGLRCILLGASPTDFGDSVSGPVLDRRAWVERLVGYFCDCGRSRLACLGGKQNNINDELRRQAFVQAARQQGLPTDASDVYTGDIVRAIGDLLDHAGKYDGVICVNDQSAVLLMREAAARGIKIPGDLFVAGSGGCIIGELVSPSLTTLGVDYGEMGQQTASMWQYLEKNPDIAAVRVTIPCGIICRESTAFIPVQNVSINVREAAFDGAGPMDAGLAPLDRLENCFQRCDALDYGIMQRILQGESTERIAEELFIAQGTVHYRIKKLCKAMHAENRRELCRLVRDYIPDPGILSHRAKNEN